MSMGVGRLVQLDDVGAGLNVARSVASSMSGELLMMHVLLGPSLNLVITWFIRSSLVHRRLFSGLMRLCLSLVQDVSVRWQSACGIR